MAHLFWGFDIVAIHFRSDEGYHYAQLVDDILQGVGVSSLALYTGLIPPSLTSWGRKRGGGIDWSEGKKVIISRRGRRDLTFFLQGGL